MCCWQHLTAPELFLTLSSMNTNLPFPTDTGTKAQVCPGGQDSATRTTHKNRTARGMSSPCPSPTPIPLMAHNQGPTPSWGSVLAMDKC